MKAKSYLVTNDGKVVHIIPLFELKRNSDGTYTAIVDDEVTVKELNNEQN